MNKPGGGGVTVTYRPARSELEDARASPPLQEIAMSKYLVEVAVGHEDLTWKIVMITVEGLPADAVEGFAEEEVLQSCRDNSEAISFVKAICVHSIEKKADTVLKLVS